MLAKYRRFYRPRKRQTININAGSLLRCSNCCLFVVILLEWTGLASSAGYGLEVSPDSINLAEEDTLYLMCSCTIIPSVSNYLLAWHFEDISAVEGGTIPWEWREWRVFGGYKTGTYDLQIQYITIKNAGIYVCTLLDRNQDVLESVSVTVSVTQIVVSDFPICLLSRTGPLSVNMEVDVVCAFKQDTLLGEQVELKQRTATGLETIATSPPTYTSSEFTVNVKIRLYLSRDHNQAEFICFASKGNLEYYTSCSFPPLQVSFRPYIELYPIFVAVSDQTEPLVFTCSVIDAYPVEVTFKWFLGNDMIGPNSDGVSVRTISNVSNELIIYRITSTDNGANVECEIENAVGPSLATGKIEFVDEEENTSEETLTSNWYLILIIGCIAVGCIMLLMLCNVYFKKKREKSQTNMYFASRPTPPKQHVFTVDRRPYSQRYVSGTNRSSGYVTRAIRGELRETPSSTSKHRSSSVSTHPLTDSGHSSLMASPEANNSSSTQHSRLATPKGRTSRHSQSPRHVPRKPQRHGHRQHKYPRNTPTDNRTRNLPRHHRHHSKDRVPTNVQNLDPDVQQTIYKKRKTRSERDRIRSRPTTEPKRTPLQYADLNPSDQSNTVRVPPTGTETDGRESRSVPQNEPIERETAPGTSENAQPISRSSTIVYAEINQSSPRPEDPLIRNEEEVHSADHVVQVNDD